MKTYKNLLNYTENLKFSDVIKKYLLDEGYADCSRSAELILKNMSVNWFNSILEQNLLEGPPRRSLRSITGPGVSDSPYQSTTSISNLALQQRRREAAMAPSQPIDRSSYASRVQSVKNPGAGVADNPNYQGPTVGLGGSIGTRDRMPGTTPSSNPYLPRGSTKSTKHVSGGAGGSPIKRTGSLVVSPAQRTYGRNLGYT